MGKLRLEVLTEAEIEKLHMRSLDVLEQVGVRVLDAECRDALVRAGATADATDRVTLPRQLVIESLKLAPKTYPMHRADGKVVTAGGDNRIFCSLVTDPWVIDYATRTPRRPVMEDFVRHTRLGDAHPIVDEIHRMDMPPADLPPDIGYIRSMEVFASNTTKHFLAAPSSDESTRDWLEVAEIVASPHTLVEHPILTYGVAMTSPLQFTGINTRILRTALRAGCPVLPTVCPMAGTTSPLSFAGTLLITNTENVFLITLTQILKPGASIAYVGAQSLTEMHDGQDLYYNADKMLWKTANIQMGKFYGLPISGETGGSLGGRYDIQTGIENGLLMLPVLACRQNLIHGLGSNYNACGMSAETLVMQADLAALLQRISAGVDTSDEMLAFDSIAAAGPGGHFLEDPLTIRMLRSGEFYTAGCFDRLGERSPNAPEDAMLAKAHARVEELLRTHTPAVPQRTVEELGRWARRKEAARGRT